MGYGDVDPSNHEPVVANERVRIWSHDGMNGCLAQTEKNDSGVLCVRFLEDAASRPNRFKEKSPAGINGMLVPVTVLLAFADIERVSNGK